MDKRKSLLLACALISEAAFAERGATVGNDDSTMVGVKAPVVHSKPLELCSPQNVSWGGGCSVTAQGVPFGGSVTFNSTADGYGGQMKVSCDQAGNMTQGQSVCGATFCAPQTVAWGSNCSGTSDQLLSGEDGTVQNSALYRDGQLGVTCNNGTLSQNGSTCTPTACPPITMTGKYPGTKKTCSGPFPAEPIWYSGTLTCTMNGATTTYTQSCQPDGTWSAQTVTVVSKG
jgi:hypothetical protein